MINWKTIDTAPKDTFVIGVWDGFNFKNPIDSIGDSLPALTWYHSGSWRALVGISRDYACAEPTHWMPLPKHKICDDEENE